MGRFSFLVWIFYVVATFACIIYAKVAAFIVVRISLFINFMCTVHLQEVTLRFISPPFLLISLLLCDVLYVNVLLLFNLMISESRILHLFAGKLILSEAQEEILRGKLHFFILLILNCSHQLVIIQVSKHIT